MARDLSVRPEIYRMHRLRPDLELSPWDSDDNGGPRWLVRDPVTSRLETVPWPECRLLLALSHGVNVDELVRTTESQTTLRPTSTEVLDFVARLGAKGWLAGGAYWPSQAPKRRRGWLVGLFSRYLYMRITLARPDAFLGRTLPLARWLGSLPALIVIAVLAALGLYLCLPRWEEFVAEAFRLASWRNLPWIVPAVIVAKLAHELAHAYAAKAGGARVNGMGVALIMLLPLPFVDVTDAWRLPSRKRFQVAAAGVAAEMAVAGLALPAWALSVSGRGRDICLVLATVALAATLVTNLNPGVRFDGYYMLSHLLRVENLRVRAARLFIRWWRGTFWGMDIPDPEPFIRGGRRLGLATYSAYSWLYRIVLYCGITMIVYRALPKVFGVAMAMTGIGMFLIRPVLGEAASLWEARSRMKIRAVATVCVLAAAAAWFVLELPRRASFPAVLRHSESVIAAPAAGELAFVRVRQGDAVDRGQALVRIRRPETESARIRAEWTEEEARRAEATAWLSPDARAQLRQRRARVTAASDLRRAWLSREEFSETAAPGPGVVETWEPWAREGVFVPRGAALGWIRHQGRSTVTALVDVAVARRLEVGQAVTFRSAAGEPAIAGVLEGIERHGFENLDDGVLAAMAGAQWTGREWRLPRPMLRITAVFDGDFPYSGQEGRLWLKTQPYSLAADAWIWATGLAARESGL